MRRILFGAVLLLGLAAPGVAQQSWTVTTEVLSGATLTPECGGGCIGGTPHTNYCATVSTPTSTVRLRFTITNTGPTIPEKFTVVFSWAATHGMQTVFQSIPPEAVCAGPTRGPAPSDFGGCRIEPFTAGQSVVFVADVSRIGGFTGAHGFSIFPQTPEGGPFFPSGFACIRFTLPAPAPAPLNVPTVPPFALLIIAAALAVVGALAVTKIPA